MSESLCEIERTKWIKEKDDYIGCRLDDYYKRKVLIKCK